MITFTAEMKEGVSRYLERAGRPVSKTYAVEGPYRELGLYKDRVRAILGELAVEGYVAIEPDGRTHWHRSVKPYRAN